MIQPQSTAPAGECMIAAIMVACIKQGDPNRLTVILDRACGKVREGLPPDPGEKLSGMTQEERQVYIAQLLAKRNGTNA